VIAIALQLNFATTSPVRNGGAVFTWDFVLGQYPGTFSLAIAKSQVPHW